MTAILVSIGVLLIGLIVGAFALPIARQVIFLWNWLLARGLPNETRSRRLKEIRSELWEEANAAQQLGYRPAEMALQHLLRWLRGVSADISWRWSYGIQVPVRLSKVKYFAYADASGDEGFKMEGGSSRFYVIGVVLTKDPKGLARSIRDVRRQLDLVRRFEFKYGQYAMSRRVRAAFFNAMHCADFRLRFLVVDKTKVNSPILRSAGHVFAGYMWRRLLQAPWGKRKAVSVVLERRRAIDPFALSGDREYVLGQSNLPPPNTQKISRLYLARARQHDLLQLADMYAGALRAYYEKGDSTYIRFLKDRTESIEFFPD